MRIALVSIWFHRGQTEITKTFKKAFEEMGHEVFVHARMGGIGKVKKQEKNRYGWDDGKVTYYDDYDLKTDWGNYVEENFVENLIRQEIDLILFNEEYDWQLVKDCKEERDWKVVTYLDYLHKDWLKEDSPLKIYNKVICSTKRAFDMVEKYCNAEWVGWGIKQEDIEVKYPWAKRPYIFFENAGWGGMNDRKGTSFMLHSYISFLEKHPEAYGSLLIHFQMYFDPTQPHWPNEKMGVGADIVCGSMNQPGLYHMGQVYCYPAILDGLGLSLLEAMANGLAVICPDASPWNEFVEHEYNGLLIPLIGKSERGDGIAFPEVFISQDRFVEAMELLYLDKQKRTDYGLNSLLTAQTRLNWDRFKIRLGNVLREL